MGASDHPLEIDVGAYSARDPFPVGSKEVCSFGFDVVEELLDNPGQGAILHRLVALLNR
jgi:hypothetical protein